jgi:hypothetical protein
MAKSNQASEEATTEAVVAKVSYTFVPIRPFPAWEGTRTTYGPRSKFESPGFFKGEFALPVPANEEQSKEMYNLSLEEILAKGVRQIHYDRDIGVKEHYNALITEDNDLDTIVKSGALPPEALWFCEVKEKKASEAAKAKELQAKTGKTLDEIDEILSDPVKAKEYLADLQAKKKAQKLAATKA